MCKMTPISVGLNLENFILISCAVLELLRKVSQGAESAPPPGEIGLKYEIATQPDLARSVSQNTKVWPCCMTEFSDIDKFQ